MKYLFALCAFVFTSLAWAQVMPARCEHNELYSNINTLVYRFSFSSECEKALENSRRTHGRFCDGDKLILNNGMVFHDFNWASQCDEAMEELSKTRTGLFCDDTSMFQIRWGFLLYHSFASDCREALKEAHNHKGFFCQGGQMFNEWGTMVRDYGFRSSCQAALSKITF